MKNPRVRLAAIALAALAVLSIPPLLFVAWARGVSGGDPSAKLPADVEALVVVPSAAAIAGPLGELAGMNLDALRHSGWGSFGGAALGIRGPDAVLVLECPRVARFGPLEIAAVDALHMKKLPGGVLEFAGRRVWLGSRANWLWIATSRELLSDSLKCAGREAALPAGVPAIRFQDRGLVARLNRELAGGRLNDVERMAWTRLRAALPEGGEVRGEFTANGLVLKGGGKWVLGSREFSKRTVASQPGGPSHLAARTIPGLALRHGDTFRAPAVWDEIVHDPENARFVDAFRREIGEYENFLGGRKFETDLLPHLGPERQWAIVHPNWNEFGVRPKSPIPIVLFAVEVRGIESEVIKSIDKFLTEAELEGKRFDLPAPKGRSQPVLDPFHHEKVTLEGREAWRIVFREGVSGYGAEFAPGYEVIDGVLWISTFWPLLTKISTVAPPGPSGHAWGVLDGQELTAFVREFAGELAEMGATWEVLDRVAADAERDFAERYGSPSEPTDAYLKAFDGLETELKRERPDMRGAALDRELEERLKAWEAGEKRAFAAQRTDRVKRTPGFQENVARRRASIEAKLDLLGGLGRVEWTLRREFIGREEIDGWEARISPRGTPR